MPELSASFHVRLIGAAPSANPEIAIPVTEPVGEVSTPEELNDSVPDATDVAVPVPPVSVAGMLMLNDQEFAPVLVYCTVSTCDAPSES